MGKEDGVPWLQIFVQHIAVEEHEQRALVALWRVRHEAAEMRACIVLPNLDVISDHASSRATWWQDFAEALLLLRYDRLSAEQFRILSHTHHQRGLKTSILLNQEYSLQRLAEEPLTLFRDVVCGVSAVPPTQSQAAVGRRRRWGGDARGDLKRTTPLPGYMSMIVRGKVCMEEQIRTPTPQVV